MSNDPYKIVSADSHFVEPPDLFTSRVDARFRDRAPRTEKASAGTAWETSRGVQGEYWIVPGSSAAAARPVAIYYSAGRTWDEMKEANQNGYAGAPDFVFDPAARIKAQERDGVAGEVMYSSYGLSLFAIEDDDLRRACFGAFNDWAAEYCGYDPKRLVGCALIDVDEPAAGARELERIGAKGLRAGMISGSPLKGRPYSLSDYDRLWATAQDLDVALTLHVHTSRKKIESSYSETTVHAVSEIQESLAHMIFGGVFERFPRLKIILCEVDVSWIPHFMYRTDHFHKRYGITGASSFSMAPSDYMRRNVWATFQNEEATIPFAAQLFGADRIMWASDFPHMNSTYPCTREYVVENFPGMRAEDIQKIVCDNAVGVYNLG